MVVYLTLWLKGLEINQKKNHKDFLSYTESLTQHQLRHSTIQQRFVALRSILKERMKSNHSFVYRQCRSNVSLRLGDIK